MKNKKLISLFLFLVLSIQVMPLQQIADWLFSNPLTEELAHSVNPVKAKSGTDEVHPPFSLHPYQSGMQAMANSLGNHHYDEAIYIRHADDILTPPPNC